MKSPKPAKSLAVKRSIKIGGHRTSISLEDQFWEALREIAKERGMFVSDLVATIDGNRREPNLSSAIRVFVLNQIAARTPSA
jgi:predicted DNA-binding ribbon-helix-helix protein